MVKESRNLIYNFDFGIEREIARRGMERLFCV